MMLQRRTQVERGEIPAEEYAVDVVTCALDLISGLCEGLGTSIEPLVAQAPVRDIVLAVCVDPAPGVRRSAFALLGDLSRSCPNQVTPSLQQFMELIIAQLQPQNVIAMNMSVCNNASWAAGELAVRTPADALRPFVAPLAQCMVQILDMRMVNRSLGENAAITLGRLAMVCPDELQGGLSHMMTSWCGALRRLRDGMEKEDGFKGLVALVQKNPNAGVGALASLLEAIASWRGCRNEELARQMGELVVGYKQHVGDDAWIKTLQHELEPGVARKLSETYGV
jgi:transportin-1